jgi:hypothetical protein
VLRKNWETKQSRKFYAQVVRDYADQGDQLAAACDGLSRSGSAPESSKTTTSKSGTCRLPAGWKKSATFLPGSISRSLMVGTAWANSQP